MGVYSGAEREFWCVGGEGEETGERVPAGHPERPPRPPGWSLRKGMDLRFDPPLWAASGVRLGGPAQVPRALNGGTEASGLGQMRGGGGD